MSEADHMYEPMSDEDLALGYNRFFGWHGRKGDVVMLTRADGWGRWPAYREKDGCTWFYLRASQVESVRPATVSSIPKIMGVRTFAKWDKWCAENTQAECCVAVVRMMSGAEHNVFGPTEDVASLIWGPVPCPP